MQCRRKLQLNFSLNLQLHQFEYLSSSKPVQLINQQPHVLLAVERFQTRVNPFDWGDKALSVNLFADITQGFLGEHKGGQAWIEEFTHRLTPYKTSGTEVAPVHLASARR